MLGAASPYDNYDYAIFFYRSGSASKEESKQIIEQVEILKLELKNLQKLIKPLPTKLI